jgi:hypothetical protein
MTKNFRKVVATQDEASGICEDCCAVELDEWLTVVMAGPDFEKLVCYSCAKNYDEMW